MTARRVRSLMEARESGWVPRGLTGPTSDELRSLARDADWRFVEVLLAGVRDKPSLMRTLADSFALPSWFGDNWDAFDECFGDLVAQEKGLLLRLKGLGSLPDGLGDPLVEIVADHVAATREATERARVAPVIVVADPPMPTGV